MSTDLYAEKYNDYSKSELYEIIEKSHVFGEYARLGAIQVLEHRDGPSSTLDAIRNSILNIETAEHIPNLYSKLLIRMFSLFFGTLFGAILLIINLRITKHKKGLIQVIIFGISYTGIRFLILNRIGVHSNYSIIINLVGGFILTEYFWNKFIGRTTEHEKKDWIKPTLIALLIIIPTTYIYIQQLELI